MQPIEYKLTIPNTFHIKRVNHCCLEKKSEMSGLIAKFLTLSYIMDWYFLGYKPSPSWKDLFIKEFDIRNKF